MLKKIIYIIILILPIIGCSNPQSINNDIQSLKLPDNYQKTIMNNTASTLFNGFQYWIHYTSGLIFPSDYKNIYFADVNGDNLNDLICITYSGWVYVSIGTGYGYNSWSWNSGGKVIATNGTVMFGDVNGDGRADLVGCATQTNPDWKTGIVCVALSFGVNTNFTGFQFWSWYSGGKVIAEGGTVMLGDVNGDGKADLVGAALQLNPDWKTGIICVALSLGNGTTTFPGFQFWSWYSGGKVVSEGATLRLSDINGDGRSDLIGASINNYTPDWKSGYILSGLSQGTGINFAGFQFWTWNSNQSILKYNYSKLLLGDINGDGRSDLIYGTPNNYGYVYSGLSLGDGIVFSGFQFWTWCSAINTISTADTIMLEEINGDGKSDLIKFINGSIFVGLSN